MTSQEFLKKLILAGSGKSALAFVKDFQEIDDDIMVTMANGDKWRVHATKVS